MRNSNLSCEFYLIVVLEKSQQMNNSKQFHDSVRQNACHVKSSQKHDANLQKNSTLYFQVGLIVCLLAAFGLLEMRFESTISEYGQDVVERTDPFEMSTEPFKVYVKPKVEVKPKVKVKKASLILPPKIIDNDEVTTKVIDIETPDNATSDVPLDPSVLGEIKKPEEVVDIVFVQQVPIYPGCEKEKGNAARKKCMSDKITRLVQKRFNGGAIASQEGLSGKQKFYVQFQIDKAGHVTEIQTNASNSKLGDEAKRVVNKIPKMQPGKQNNKPIGVRYTLPITFIAH